MNASAAVGELMKLGAATIPFLEAALRTGDYQTQQFSAAVLMELGKEYSPSQRFFEVLVEGFQDDQFPYGKGTVFLSNAMLGWRYFTDHPNHVGRAVSSLTSALTSPDGQQRFLAALVLGNSGRSAHGAQIAPILVAHLKENYLATDATLAAFALERLGESSRPYLLEAQHSEDSQQVEYARKILRQLDAGTLTHLRAAPMPRMYTWKHPSLFPEADGSYRPDQQLPLKLPRVGMWRTHFRMLATKSDSLTPRNLLPPGSPIPFTVGEGDTLDEIARLFIVSVDSIIELNHLDPGEELQVGSVVLIPPTDF